MIMRLLEFVFACIFYEEGIVFEFVVEEGWQWVTGVVNGNIELYGQK